MAVYTSRRLFTVTEFEQMDQAGIFREDDRLELIDGEIFAMAPIGSRHAAVEVADTSLAYDQEIKVPAYARSQIPEVWVVDLTSAAVHVYRLPSPAGYRDITCVQSGATLAPQSFPDLALPVAHIVA